MNFHELVGKVRTALVFKADASKVTEHIAGQVNVTGEAEGIFYIEIKDGNLVVEPYSYNDNHFELTCDGEEILAVAQGKKSLESAILNGAIAHNWQNWEKVLVLSNIIPTEAEPTAEEPKQEEIKAEEPKQEEAKAEEPKEEKPKRKATGKKSKTQEKPADETSAEGDQQLSLTGETEEASADKKEKDKKEKAEKAEKKSPAPANKGRRTQKTNKASKKEDAAGTADTAKNDSAKAK